MRKLIIILALITLCFAQKPTSRTPANTDWVKITDTNGRGWDHTRSQFFNVPFTMTNTYRTGAFSINIVDTFTQIQAAAHKSIKVDLTYSPVGAGTAAPIAIVGKVNLNGDLTAANSYAGMGWGVQGQMHVVDGSTIDGSTYGSPGAVYAGLRGVVTDGSGTTTYTKGILTAVYAEIQMNQQNAEDNGDFDIYGIYIRNQGVATSPDLTAGLYMDVNTVQGGTNFEIGVDINDAVVGIEIDATTTGLDFQGAYSNAAIDLTDITLNYSGASGPVMIRAGTYANPVSSSDAGQSGMIRLYGLNTATTDDEASGYYDRGIFAYLRTDGSKGIFPISGLAEVRTVSGNGPTDVMAGQFIAGLHTSSSKLAATAGTTDGMFGLWSKVYSVSGAVAAATSRVASIWLDSQLHGATSGENYAAFITNGGLKEDAVFAFETGNNAGWTNLLYFDETAYDQDPISALGAKNEVNSDKSIKIDLNGTTYYIPIFLVANME